MPRWNHPRFDPPDWLRPRRRNTIRPPARSALKVLIFSALSAGLIAGCGPANHPARTEPPTAPTPAPAPTTATPARRAPVTPPTPTPLRQACSLTVDGQLHVQGPCLVYPFGDGGYTLNAWSDGKPRQSHFAVVTLNADGTALATWNADPDDTRAGDPLGTVRLVDGCWVNARARICAVSR